MEKNKKERVITANFKNFFCKRWHSIRATLEYLKDMLDFNVKKTDIYGYIGLGPTDDADNIAEYIRALDWALKEKNITNIALAGPFGAGKSSIINTFLKKHPSIKYINISLAAFRENDQEKIECTDEKFEKDLEEGILKQLFYKVHYSRIPQSRYRKLHKVSYSTSFIRVLFIVTLIFCYVFLFVPSKLYELTKEYSRVMTELFDWGALHSITFAIGFGLIIILIMTSLLRWIDTKWKSVEINIADKAFIKANEQGEALSLNKNMDEILYFFEETDYTLLVIEDLDRFDTPVVYTKLREINKIINDYEAIQRRVIFIYSLKDDIFYNEDRTKFFDFIIPVVPYIDATNSGEYLKNRLVELRKTGLQFNISSDYIMNVAPFISDMRVLNNICNEFIVFKKTIKDSQNLIKLEDEQMFSIMIFKNIYPEEFAKLQETEGIIKQAYSYRSDFIKSISEDLQSEIKRAEEDKQRADSREILCAEDIKFAFIMKLVGERGIFIKLKGTKGTFTKSEILKSDFKLSQIGNGPVTVHYRPINSYGESTDIIPDIDKMKCSDGISYYEKCDRAVARDMNYLKQLELNLIDKQNELYGLRSKTMKMLIKEYGANTVLGEDVTKNKLLVFMLRHGYIDDTYPMYINYFLPGSITADELNFIINVRYYTGETDWDYRIIHPQNVVSRLFDYELEQQKECLNFDLAAYFYENEKKSDKKTAFTKQLAQDDEDSRKFIKEYYVRAKNRAEYIRSIAQQKPLFWFDICVDESLGYQDKVKYLKDIFLYLELEDIVFQDTAAKDEDIAYSICSFIVKSEGVIALLQEAGADKIVSVLVQINAKLKSIDLDTLDYEIILGVYENELFEISLLMLQKYADFKTGEPVLDFQEHIYTSILELEDVSVIEYLERNITEFVSGVILETEANTNETIDTIFKCIRLLDYDEDLSIKLIQKMDIIMNNLEDWINSVSDKRKNVRKIVDAFLKNNKLKATIENLDAYKANYQFSTELCDFVNINIDTLLADENINDAHVKEFLKNDIQERTIEKILQNYEMEPFIENLNGYRDNVVKIMILLKYFEYTRSRYNEIITTFPNMLPLFVKYYWDEFEPEIQSISFDSEVLDKLIESDLDDEKKAVLLNRADASQMTNAMHIFVRNTKTKVPKRFLQATWDKLGVNDRPAFLAKHYSAFNINEIQNMFVQMPDEYHSLIQKDNRHEAYLANNSTNEILLKGLKRIGYISSYDLWDKKKSLFIPQNERLIARVRAKS